MGIHATAGETHVGNFPFTPRNHIGLSGWFDQLGSRKMPWPLQAAAFHIPAITASVPLTTASVRSATTDSRLAHTGWSATSCQVWDQTARFSSLRNLSASRRT